MTQIHPFALWLGHAGDGRNIKLLLDAGIEAVIQLAAEEPILQLPRELVYCHIPLLDGSGNDPKLLALAVHAAARCCTMQIPTLVCCSAGLSRSPVVAAAALAVAHNETPEKWLKQIAQYHICDVAPAFWNEIPSRPVRRKRDDRTNGPPIFLPWSFLLPRFDVTPLQAISTHYQAGRRPPQCVPAVQSTAAPE